jgi:two-component system sensor histidine kinase DesK
MASLIPWRQARFALVGWALVLSLVGLLGHLWMPVFIAALSLGIGLAMAGGMESSRVTRMLEHSQTRVETLTVAAERERISRDLHDILGHSLTAITIKSSLAVRLADTDPAAAKEQMAAVEAIARQALADVRATASGLTEIRLATEIASARARCCSRPASRPVRRSRCRHCLRGSASCSGTWFASRSPTSSGTRRRRGA